MSIARAGRQVLKVRRTLMSYGPEEIFSRERSRGTGPRATGQEVQARHAPVLAQASPNYSGGPDAFQYSPALQGRIITETEL